MRKFLTTALMVVGFIASSIFGLFVSVDSNIAHAANKQVSKDKNKAKKMKPNKAKKSKNSKSMKRGTRMKKT